MAPAQTKHGIPHAVAQAPAWLDDDVITGIPHLIVWAPVWVGIHHPVTSELVNACCSSLEKSVTVVGLTKTETCPQVLVGLRLLNIIFHERPFSHP
jgi:hypothetical protein